MDALKLACVACFVCSNLAQVPIPTREVGYVYKQGQANASIHIDAFLDLICPGSKESFPTLKAVAEHYGPSILQFTVHFFPLPYHRNSFYATKGAHAMASLTEGNKTFDWIKLVYDHIDSLVNSATNQFSEDQMKMKLADLAHDLGLMPELFIPLLDNPTIEEDTRVAWKYACSRGVVGTPTFMVNDVVVAGSPTWTLNDWTKLIDSVLKPTELRINHHVKVPFYFIF
ncbi:hypothetical protein LOTGIDRAFT_104342 [Lottia gigantea]|uniref:Thioredoxin-like fold domain-containing protein n=1 Tax=Lottia gigantea TaxID=225164 RepID=V4AKU2_LOTGI|nr:hypothetical protein LOTGIDRAFT_104342 [Lottia gigantea]ESO97752.1 hypothetical protein LOTGIDRAFT_104342 [Lottia gigantea]